MIECIWFLYFVDVSQIHMIKKLQAKGDSGKEEIFQRVVFGRTESHEIKDYFLRKKQKNMHDFESLWTDDERNDRGTSISITTISPIEELMIVEVMQETSLLKGMDQAFRISCIYLNLKGQFLNVVRL